MAPLYPSLSRANIFFLIVFTIELIAITGVNSRPSPLPQDIQIRKNSGSEFAEQDETSENLEAAKEDVLQEIIDDVLEYRRRKESAERINVGLHSEENPSEDIFDQDSSEMMGDMPFQDADTQGATNPIESILRQMNFFPTGNLGADGMDQGGAIQKIIIHAPSNLNNSNERESYMEELANMSLNAFNGSSLMGKSNTSHTTSPSGGIDPRNVREIQEFALVERMKEMRLLTIKEQVLNFFEMFGRPQVENSTTPSKQIEIIEDLYKKMKNQTWPPADIYTSKVQSFYPSCDVPKNTDEDLWHDSHAMNLLFDLSTPTVSNGTTVNVIAAKLRLYKLSQSNSSALPVAMYTPSGAGIEAVSVPTTASSIPVLEDDQKIRVSVYWYTRSLKKNKLKRKLLDSKMLSIHGDELTEFNVKQAAIEWRNKLKPNRNFGLVVEVENEDNVILPAAQYLSAMNCSKEASTARPIPGFLVDAARYYIMGTSNRTNDSRPTRNASLDFNSSINYHAYLFPMIDLCTNEVPVHEAERAALYIHAQHMAQHSVQPGDHLRNTIGSVTNASEMFQQYQNHPNKSAADRAEDDEAESLRQHRLNQHHQGEPTTTPLRVNSPIRVELHSSRAVRQYPRRHLESVPHRRRHHHGDGNVQHGHEDSDQAKRLDPNGFELRKQIIQKVILNQQRNTTGTIHNDR